MTYPRPIVIISRCLGFGRCRYNGEVLSNPFIEQFKPWLDFRPVCPEMEIGLPMPRDPIRIVQSGKRLVLYQPATGRDLTQVMAAFNTQFVAQLAEVDGFLLKSRSPTCGPAGVKIYANFQPDARVSAGAGFFARALRKKWSGRPMADEGRLNNFAIREHFLTWLFTRARFRKIAEAGRIRDLVAFQAQNKYLFLALNQDRMRVLGRIAARRSPGSARAVFSAYENELDRLFQEPPTVGAWINVLQHAVGHLNQRLSSRERLFFQNLVEEYRDERVPLSSLTALIQSWALRFDESYLAEQSFLAPFPPVLRSLVDSGRRSRP